MCFSDKSTNDDNNAPPRPSKGKKSPRSGAYTSGQPGLAGGFIGGGDGGMGGGHHGGHSGHGGGFWGGGDGGGG
jgi:hypothetical protein